jgi:hypothetical protein
LKTGLSQVFYMIFILPRAVDKGGDINGEPITIGDVAWEEPIIPTAHSSIPGIPTLEILESIEWWFD